MGNVVEIKDCELIADILNKAFLTVALQFGFTQENAARFPAFIGPDAVESSLKNGLRMYGFNKNSQITSCVGYRYYRDGIYLIERLATLPEHRHTGIGRKLMMFCENKIIEHGGKTAEIHVVDRNELLVEWYNKLNYRKTRTDEIKTLPFNSVVMNKSLA
jgi:GNAT superfamily N-acetyltransferase